MNNKERRAQMLILFPFTKQLEEKLKKEKKKTSVVPFRLDNKESLLEIISHPAYKDMQPRLLKGIGQHKKDLDTLFDALAEMFFEYFTGETPRDVSEFDAVHSEMCGMIVNKMLDMGMEQFRYGQAQKLVNMAFKHFYCFEDAADKESYFIFCHIPIDSRILDEFQGEEYDHEFHPNHVWSKMEYEEYMGFQKTLRDYLKKTKNNRFRHENGEVYTPLEVDFYIQAKEFCIDNCNAWLAMMKPYEDFQGWHTYKSTDTLVRKLSEVQNVSKMLIGRIKQKGEKK